MPQAQVVSMTFPVANIWLGIISTLPRHPPALAASWAHLGFLDEQMPSSVNSSFVSSTDATGPRSQINMVIQTTLCGTVHNSGNSIMLLWQQQHKLRLGGQTLFSEVPGTDLHAFTGVIWQAHGYHWNPARVPSVLRSQMQSGFPLTSTWTSVSTGRCSIVGTK